MLEVWGVKDFTELMVGKFFVIKLAFIAIPFVLLKHFDSKNTHIGGNVYEIES